MKHHLLVYWQKVASKLSLCVSKNRTVVEKFGNRNLIDWRNCNKSLVGKIYKFDLVDRCVGSGWHRST